MFFKKKENASNVTMGQALGIIIGTVALCVAIGAARWSWYTVEELISMRQDFNELRNEEDQLKIQFDFWDQKVSDERRMIRQMRDKMTNVNATP
ncbi:MAG TPA: hypothetical protein VL426_03090 [Candidatus Binatia bacterium]|nr:hypothetical protein [Candidatus Binatia bacterium]